MTTGRRVTDAAPLSTATSVVALNAVTGQAQPFPVANLAAQLVASGPVAEALEDIVGAEDLTSLEARVGTVETGISDLQALGGTVSAPAAAGGPVAVATTANITLSGEQTIDGVLTSETDTLVKDQTAPEENGIYTTAAGAWVRRSDMDAAGEVQATSVYVTGGSTNNGKTFATYSPVTTLGTDPITWILVADEVAGLASKADLASPTFTGVVTAEDLALTGSATLPAPTVSDRDGTLITLFQDSAGRALIEAEPSGAIVLHSISATTLAALREGLVPETYGVFPGVPGWNHRTFDPNNYLVTMPTPFGSVDVIYPTSGSGLQFAATAKPVEIISCSGQSNTYLGGDVANNIDGFALRDIWDNHRAFRPPVKSWGDGSGSAAAYVEGDISSITPSGQTGDSGADSDQFLPDAIQFSIIALDDRDAQPQTVYVTATSAESGTPLTQYVAGTVKGDNIAGFIPGMETAMSSLYGRDTIMYAHFLIGHEGTDFTGYASYSDLLSSFADEVCGYGAALAQNVAAGVRPKVLVYQPNNYTTDAGTENGTTIRQTALDTLTTALSDPDVVCIGPVYHERAADDGIHMTGKLMTAELFAHVYQLVRAGGDFEPLHITGAVRSGTTITLTLDGPDGFAYFDNDWIPTLVNYGIHFDDDTSSATITDVSISNTSATNRSIILTLDTAPTGANPTVYISGHNNISDPHRPGGMAAIYVPGPRSAWYRAGFTEYTLPTIRFYLARQAVAVTT